MDWPRVIGLFIMPILCWALIITVVYSCMRYLS